MKIHKKSKRQTTRLRAKIEKKVKEHKRKARKAAKKNPSNAHKRRKDPGVPNSLPFKEAVLKEAEDRKNLLEEERLRQKEKRKKEKQKLLEKNRGLDGMVKDAAKRSAEFDKKQGSQLETKGKGKGVESSLKTYYKEFKKVVDAADVVLEVLDARDPLGSRCHQMEQTVISTGTEKRLVLVLNKIDLVPRENVEAWMKHLRNEFPVVAFKASTQVQNDNLCRKKIPITQANEDLIQSSGCLGADVLMKLLGNYCRNKDIKTTIRVGVVGLPNTGKSSIINSLKRSKTCSVGAMPGITKQMQEVSLDKHIRLLDSPGVVMATGTSDTSVILRNCVNLENLQDPAGPVEAILKRCNKNQMMLHYCITDYKDVSEFLALLATRLGRLKKGGVPDIGRAARTVLHDWTRGRITYYTHPPEQNASTHVSAEFVSQMDKEFDIDALLGDQQKIIDKLDKRGTKHMLVESLGAPKIVLDPGQITKMSTKEEGVHDDDDEEMLDEEEEEEENDEEMEDEEMSDMTVSLPTTGPRSRTTSENGKKASKSPKAGPYEGLLQANKQRRMDFKKMKKQRKRRDKVAGELSDALTSAFKMDSGKSGEDYNFGDHFSMGDS